MPSVIPHSAMSTSNSTLSKRRRFQPPITNFFNSTPTDAEPSDAHAISHNHYAAATFSATPAVPPKVQASLLSVGMRVRKSVADGYKTQLAMKNEKVMPPSGMTESAVIQPYYGNNGHAELAPFSGLSKSAHDAHYNSNNVVTDDGDAFSLPTSSQESNKSSVSFPDAVNGQKRSLDSDIFVDNDALEDDASSAWQVPSVGRHILSPSLGQQRRRMLALRGTIDRPTMDLDDFEEASFLRQREEVDADYVHMDCDPLVLP